MSPPRPIARGPVPILRQSLGAGWRALGGWIVGVAAVILLYLPLYPSMNSPELAGMLDSLPPELINTLNYDDITSGAGYTHATFFGLIGFALLTIAAVGWGSAAIAGAEESGRLELTLAHAVGRAQYGLESAAAVLVRVLAVGVAGYGLIWAIDAPSQLDLDPVHLVAEVLAWTGLGMLAGSAALAAGALTGRRIWATGTGAAIAVAGFALQAAANNSDDLEPLRVWSPMHWAYGRSPLQEGFDPAGLALLWGGAALLIAVAVIALRRRDVLG